MEEEEEKEEEEGEEHEEEEEEEGNESPPTYPGRFRGQGMPHPLFSLTSPFLSCFYSNIYSHFYFTLPFLQHHLQQQQCAGFTVDESPIAKLV